MSNRLVAIYKASGIQIGWLPLPDNHDATGIQIGWLPLPESYPIHKAFSI